jgi:hypothetical protein
MFWHFLSAIILIEFMRESLMRHSRTAEKMWGTVYLLCSHFSAHKVSGVPRNFVRGGGSTNSVEDRENGDRRVVAPQSGVLEAAVIWYKKFHFI